jgi:hypothetical protein
VSVWAAWRCDTVTRPARSRSVAAAAQSAARGRAAPTVSTRSSLGLCALRRARPPDGRDGRADAGRREHAPLRRTGEPVGAEIDETARSTSKSAVSREFVSRTREHLIELMSRPLDLRLAVLMLDGIELKGRCCVVALGMTATASRTRSRAVGRLDRERHRRDHAAGQPRRARPGRRPRRAGGHRRRQGAAAGPSATCSAPTRRCSAACASVCPEGGHRLPGR